MSFRIGALLLLGWFVFLPARGLAQEAATTEEAPVRARITSVDEREVEGAKVEVYRAEILEGSSKGKTVSIGDNEEVPTVNNRVFKAGDRVLVTVIHHIDGTDHHLISDYERRPALLWLVVIFVVSVIWLGRWHGFRSLIGLAFSYLVIIRWIVPLITSGYDPVSITLIGSAAILIVSFLITEGFSRLTWAAAAGTVATMIIISLISRWSITFTRLTGDGSEEAFFLQNQGFGNIDIQGLLLAGIIIGTLGLLDDVAIAQVAAVGELRRSNPRQSNRQVYAAAMRIGRSHLAAIVNTLLLAYAGTALPLLVLFTAQSSPTGAVLNSELIGAEVVRSILGSMGILLALPLTTIIAVWMKVRSTHRDAADAPHVHG